MKLEKYHGCGNDFLITEDLSLIYNPEEIKKMCLPKVGLEADGLIIVKTNPLEMLIYNADGSFANMCGNGIRCFTHYCYLHNLLKGNNGEILTHDGKKTVEIKSLNPFICQIMMGAIVPFKKLKLNYDTQEFLVYSINFGVPHIVIYTSELDEEKIKKIGSYFSLHHSFKEGTNVNFVKKIDEETLYVTTYERGAGLTLACGTGSCASYIVSRGLNIITKEQITVKFKYQSLKISEKDGFIYMEGPSTKIAEIKWQE